MYEFESLVNAMHNHERHVWAKDGYPGLKRHSAEELLKHPSGQMAQQKLEEKDDD